MNHQDQLARARGQQKRKMTQNESNRDVNREVPFEELNLYIMIPIGDTTLAGIQEVYL